MRRLGGTAPKVDLADEYQAKADALGPGRELAPGARVAPSKHGDNVIQLIRKAQAPEPEDDDDEASRRLLQYLALYEDD